MLCFASNVGRILCDRPRCLLIENVFVLEKILVAELGFVKSELTSSRLSVIYFILDFINKMLFQQFLFL